jgi:hypothetical protein
LISLFIRLAQDGSAFDHPQEGRERETKHMIGLEEGASLTDISNFRQKGTRLGNWLARELVKELLAVPDLSTLRGKRDKPRRFKLTITRRRPPLDEQ